MTTCIYVDGVIASDSRVTSGTDINPVYFKKTYKVEGKFADEELVGAAIAGNAMRKKLFLEWLAKGAPLLEYIPRFQDGLQALILTKTGIWLYSNGEMIEGWDGISIGSGGSKATAFFNVNKNQKNIVNATDCIKSAICPTSGDSASGGMIQWISRDSNGTTAMPSTVLPEHSEQYESVLPK